MGSPKNERENLEPDELDELRVVGRNWLNALPGKIAQAIEDGALEEVGHDEQNEI